MRCRSRVPVIITLVAASLAFQPPARAATTVAFQRIKATGVAVNVVTVDLNSPNVRVTPAIAKAGIGTAESFRSIMRRTQPAAAINGTFFCTRTLKPTGDIVIDGHLLARGSRGTAVAIGPGNKVTFLPSRLTGVYRWDRYDHVLAAGPALVLRGRTIVHPRNEGFGSGVHYSRRIRSAVGLTYHNKLVMVSTRRPVYLSELARVMKRLKCVDAAALDGGSSTGLYCKGKIIANPSRSMTNCLLVYDRVSDYEQRKSALYPTTRFTSAPPSGS